MAGFADVLKSALELPTDDRAALAYKLLASLDELDEAEAERLWTAEASRRREQYLTGRVVASDAPVVADKASRLFR